MRFLIYGDSISSGTHGGGAYLSYLEKRFNAELTNRSVGSSGLDRATPSSMLSVLDHEVDESYDLVIIWHGSNDWYWGVTIESFKRSIEEAVKRVRYLNPLAPIIWISPLYRYEAPSGKEEKCEAINGLNKENQSMIGYISALKEKAEELYFDLFDISSVVQINKYNAHYFLEDDVHPNRAGYQRIEKAIGDEIERILSPLG